MVGNNNLNYKCVCGSTNFKDSIENGVNIDECLACGIKHQHKFPFTDETNFNNYYKSEYPPVKKTYEKVYEEKKQLSAFESDTKLPIVEHDIKVSIMRCDKYNISGKYKGKMVLDVGSGSGAFVAECRERGATAYGCEISKYNYNDNRADGYIYYNRIEDVHFPTDYFDLLTCHDVVEHLLNPMKFIEELFRITKQQGECIIDLPRFFHDDGKHHWKDNEHLWYFTTEQFEKLAKEIGFDITKIDHPISSKTVFYLKKPVQNRTKILFPPGMGDSLWSIVKLQSFIEKNNLKSPIDAYIVCPRERKYEGHKRSVPFLQLFPFINSTGTVYEFSQKNPEHAKLWKNAYARAGDTVFKGTLGCDYFISYNGFTISKKTLEKADEYNCNWDLPMFESLEQIKYKEDSIKKYGNYLILYFPFYGMYKSWLDNFSAENLAESINLICNQTKLTPIFVGKEWDEDDEDCRKFRLTIKNAIDLTGKTSTDGVFGLIKGAKGMLAFPSGLPIMSTILGQKVLMIWNDYWKKEKNFAVNFAKRCCPPSTVGNTYYFEMANNLTVDKLVNSAIKLITGKLPNKKVVVTKEKKEVIPHVKKVNKLDLTIACVLKTGGDFTADYVKRLYNMVNRNTTVPYKFVCFTDNGAVSDICNIIQLKHGYNRWWSKIELFRPGLIDSEYIAYFDLDSVILKNIDSVLKVDGDFVALNPWNTSNRKNGMCASGMMKWKNDGSFSFIYNKFTTDNISKYPRGDQEYISKVMSDNNRKFIGFQDMVKGIYSYKRNCRRILPSDASVICFHGRPRPKDVNTNWVKENWK